MTVPRESRARKRNETKRNKLRVLFRFVFVFVFISLFFIASIDSIAGRLAMPG